MNFRCVTMMARILPVFSVAALYERRLPMPKQTSAVIDRRYNFSYAAHAICGIAVALCVAVTGWTADVPKKNETDLALERGLEFLSSKQRADGSWSENPAISGLVMTAFMSCGHVPGEGPYGELLQKGLDHILTRQEANGSFAAHGQMYGHGIITLMLAEVVGMSDNPKAKDALAKAIAITLRAQNVQKDAHNAGGWRYGVDSGDSDISVTGWQLLALRAARNGGVDVPADSIARGVAYVKRLAVPVASGGGFGYQWGSNPNRARTGAGTLALQLCGAYDSPEAKAGVEYLSRNPMGWGGEWYFYSLYYGAQANYQAGGQYWEKWKERMDGVLLPKQREDGSWPYPPRGEEQGRAGELYPTAMIILALAVQYNYLPAYQR